MNTLEFTVVHCIYELFILIYCSSGLGTDRTRTLGYTLQDGKRVDRCIRIVCHTAMRLPLLVGL
jgi:hypothetical protein